MKTNKTYIGLILLAAGLLAGCSGSEGNDVNELKPELTNEAEKTEISVKTNLSRMLTGTRATAYTSNTVLQTTDLKVDAYFNGLNTKYLNGAKLHYNPAHSPSPAWVFWSGDEETHYYWPIEGSVYDPSSANITVGSLDFVGYCPFEKPPYIVDGPTYDYSAGTITFTSQLDDYMTSTAQADIKEFMCAMTTNRRAAGGAVPLDFKHSFAYIKFNLSTATTKNVKVNYIKIDGLLTRGVCCFTGSTSTSVWSSRSNNAMMTLTEELQRDVREETSPFLVIPYDSYPTKTLTVKVTWTVWDEEHEQVYDVPLDIDWQPGYSYTYTLTITKDDLKVDINRYTEQW